MASVNVQNKFFRVKKKNGLNDVNQLDLDKGNWSINGVDVNATADDLNSTSTGGFTFINTLFFAEGGNNTFSGTNPNKPFADLQKCIEVANTLTGFVCIYGVGAGTITQNISVTRNKVHIDAPGFDFLPLSGDALTLNLPNVPVGESYFYAKFKQILSPGFQSLNVIAAPRGTGNVLEVVCAGWLGDVTLEDAVSIELSCDVMGALNSVVNTEALIYATYGISSVANAFGGRTVYSTRQVTGNLFYAGISNAARKPIINLTTNYIATNANQSEILINKTANAYNVTLPFATNELVGFEIYIINAGAGSINFLTQGSDVIIGTTIINTVDRVTALIDSLNTWIIN